MRWVKTFRSSVGLLTVCDGPLRTWQLFPSGAARLSDSTRSRWTSATTSSRTPGPLSPGCGYGFRQKPPAASQLPVPERPAFTWRIALRGEKEVTIWGEGGAVKNTHAKKRVMGVGGRIAGCHDRKTVEGKTNRGGRTGRRCTGLSTLRARIISSGETGNLHCRNLHKAQ